MIMVHEGMELVSLCAEGYSDVHLGTMKSINWKERINIALMNLMTISYQISRNSDHILNDFCVLMLDLPSNIRRVLRTCTSFQPKFISSGVTERKR